MPNFYCFLGVSIHDCRDSQPSSGWLRKVGVPDFGSPTTVVNNDVTSHRTNPLDPVFSPFLAYVPVSGIAMFVQVICQVKTTRLSNFYCFLGVSIHDCRDSQSSSGWLRKVGVL
ncbi:hypothetical protein, partial [Aeromonas salmonicida]